MVLSLLCYANGMKRFYVNKPLNVDTQVKIDGIEHNHIKNVMRMVEGDEIILVCGDDYDYMATIVKITKGDTTVEITNKQFNEFNPKSNVSVFQALVKSDNMSLIVQKLTELGVKDFYPFESDFITSKDKFGKSGKLQEISNQSIKQCKRSIPMTVHDTLAFNDLLHKLGEYDLIVFANECEKNEVLNQDCIHKASKVAIVVGSEGGFSQKEIDLLISNNAQSVSLGRRILRAETAAIALTSVVMFLMGEWSYE